MLVDSHCHLDLMADAQQVLDRAARQGVETIVCVSENPESMRAVLGLKAAYGSRIRAGLGLHPSWVVENGRPAVDQGLRFLAEEIARADLLGEVGLDYAWAANDDLKRLQAEALEAQLEMAAGARLPVNLHSRRAQRQVMEIAVAYHLRTGLNAQLHWFTHSKKLVRVCNREGIFVSVGPAVLHDARTQEVALQIDDHLLLLESDAPVPIGGRPGHPQRVAEVAACLAELKGLPLDALARLTLANFQRFMGKASGPTSRK